MANAARFPSDLLSLKVKISQTFAQIVTSQWVRQAPVIGLGEHALH